MKLKDISKGSDWVLRAVFMVSALISIVLLTGHGANLIAGCNTAGEEEKNRYGTMNL